MDVQVIIRVQALIVNGWADSVVDPDNGAHNAGKNLPSNGRTGKTSACILWGRVNNSLGWELFYIMDSCRWIA